MRVVSLLAWLLLGACANVNASGEATRVSNPSCIILCFDRRVPAAEWQPRVRP